MRLHNLIFVATTPSTNDLGKVIVERMLEESEEIRLTVIVAGEQTAGRGRSGRTWTPLPGALALSAIVPWPEGPGRVRLPIETGHPPRARTRGRVRDRRAAEVAERSPRRAEEDRRDPRRGPVERRGRRLGRDRLRPERPRHAGRARRAGPQGRDVARGVRTSRPRSSQGEEPLDAVLSILDEGSASRAPTRSRRRSRPFRRTRRAIASP